MREIKSDAKFDGGGGGGGQMSKSPRILYSEFTQYTITHCNEYDIYVAAAVLWN